MRKQKLLKVIQEEKHVVGQWRILIEHPINKSGKEIIRTIKRIQRAPQSQSGCEQSNRKYARYKTKYSNRMGLDMIRARSRAGENGPPMSLFNSQAVSQYWRRCGHRSAITKNSQSRSKTLNKLKNKAMARYKSKIFL